MNTTHFARLFARALAALLGGCGGVFVWASCYAPVAGLDAIVLLAVAMALTTL